MYDEMEEEEMNLSYNSLPECLNLKISEQLINLSELFNPLVNRAKLYSNPLFRQDVMNNNSKIKKWGKGVLQKTKALGSFLATPISPSSSVDSEIVATSSNDDSDGYTSYTDYTDYTDNKKNEKEKLVTSSDSNKTKNTKNFFSRLFKPKKKNESVKDTLAPRDRKVQSNPTYSDDDISVVNHPTYDTNSLKRHESEKLDRTVKHVDHHLYRSYSDDFNSSLFGTNEGSLHSGILYESNNEDGESCVWLNVNSSGYSHSHAAMPMFGTTRRMNGYSKAYISPPPAQPSSPATSVISDDGIDDNDDSCNEDVFISLDSTNSNTQSEMIDFDVFNQTPVFPNSMSSSSIAAPSGFYETKDIPVDPNTLATANIIGKK